MCIRDRAEVGREVHAEHAKLQTWSDAATVSESICRDKALLPSDDWLYFEPAHSSSVLSAFSLRRFADIHVADFRKASFKLHEVR